MIQIFLSTDGTAIILCAFKQATRSDAESIEI